MLKPSSTAWGPFELEFEAQADEIELHSHPVWIDDNFTKRRHGNDGIPNGWDSGFIRIYPDREAIWLSFYHLTCWLDDVSPIYRYTVVDVAPEKKQLISKHNMWPSFSSGNSCLCIVILSLGFFGRLPLVKSPGGSTDIVAQYRLMQELNLQCLCFGLPFGSLAAKIPKTV